MSWWQVVPSSSDFNWKEVSQLSSRTLSVLSIEDFGLMSLKVLFACFLEFMSWSLVAVCPFFSSAFARYLRILCSFRLGGRVLSEKQLPIKSSDAGEVAYRHFGPMWETTGNSWLVCGYSLKQKFHLEHACYPLPIVGFLIRLKSYRDVNCCSWRE